VWKINRGEASEARYLDLLCADLVELTKDLHVHPVDRFPMRAVFGLHNRPGLPSGLMGVRVGPPWRRYAPFLLRSARKAVVQVRRAEHLAHDPDKIKQLVVSDTVIDPVRLFARDHDILVA
jgi:hypothetical protein